MKSLTAADRKNLIRLAASLPKGDKQRLAILAGLKEAGRDPLSSRDAETIDQKAKKRWSMVGRFDVKRMTPDTVLVMIPVGGSPGRSLSKLVLLKKTRTGLVQEDLYESVEEGDHKAAERAV